MATAATIKKNIAKLEAALKSKATPKSLKSKLEAQLVKSKAELSGINKGTKPKTSSTKSTQTALQKLKEMVNKNKKLKTYKKSGVDLEKDADRPAKPIGKRTAKSGNTYYEYRANRIDVKQPPKRYPKLEKGGYMAKGGEFDKPKVSFEISVPYNFEKVVKDEYDFVEFLSKTLTKKWFGSGVWGVKVTKKLFTKNDNQYVIVEVEIPLAFKSVDKFDIEELLSKTLTKKYFGNGVWGVKQVSKKEEGGYMAKGGSMGLQGKLEMMSEKYQEWLHKNNLPIMSADELLVEESVNLTDEQRKYLENFYNEWMEEQDKYAKGGIIELKSVGTYLRTSDMTTSPSKDFKNEGEINFVYENSDEWWDALSEKDKNTIAEYNKVHSKKKAKFQVDDVVYHKGHNTIGIVRLEEERGELKTDADGNVDVDELEYYNPLKHEAHKNAKIAPSTKKEIEERGLWNPFSERTSKLGKGGYYADGGYVAVSEKDGYWYIMSKPTTKDKAQEMINLGVPSGEVGKVVTLDEAKSHKKVIGAEYLKDGGYMAKGGLTEHGLKLGDTIIGKGIYTIKVSNKETGFATVNLNTGEREEMKAMGGEMHRTQE